MNHIAGVYLKNQHPLCRFKIGGFQKFTLIDFPGKPACIVFTQGCNFRCGYCYNVELVLPERFGDLVPHEKVLDFLRDRVGLLEGVVITGGEPTIQQGIVEFTSLVKEMGYKIKLDTNGSKPDVLEGLIEDGLVDYIAMDVKAPLHKYNEVCGVNVNLNDILRSISAIMSSGIDYEFRTTVVREQLSKEDIILIAEIIKGSKRYYLQRFIPGKTLDPSFSNKSTYSEDEFSSMVQEIRNYFQECGFR
ncbi:MAG: anaerobic ribonucleoside-triphosphate reductase activating protein [Aquificaceae bacterium]|nr:anaerobic ribonucleoside-triphosphate reductase activating protein [Aquificaceae bacterium]MDW8423952.1 anaerobic ribonucleoside-triphosphate reductase activating protein [Aquificaceae bacterium]